MVTRVIAMILAVLIGYVDQYLGKVGVWSIQYMPVVADQLRAMIACRIMKKIKIRGEVV